MSKKSFLQRLIHFHSSHMLSGMEIKLNRKVNRPWFIQWLQGATKTSKPKNTFALHAVQMAEATDNAVHERFLNKPLESKKTFYHQLEKQRSVKSSLPSNGHKFGLPNFHVCVNIPGMGRRLPGPIKCSPNSFQRHNISHLRDISENIFFEILEASFSSQLPPKCLHHLAHC